MTTQARREVQSEGHFFNASILWMSSLRAGFTRFSICSPLEMPTRSRVRGLLPFATTKTRGGFSFSLNLWATLRPLSVGSQQRSVPIRRPRLRLRLPDDSVRTSGSFMLSVWLSTQYTSQGSPPKSTFLSVAVSWTSKVLSPLPIMKEATCEMNWKSPTPHRKRIAPMPAKRFFQETLSWRWECCRFACFTASRCCSCLAALGSERFQEADSSISCFFPFSIFLSPK
mmetsp:Transcript_126812/g.394712  ORF Transcript_126812/g.394712 Transcript_126812/m.394712 type:complete len:227 (+) Transcript_126812:689-1369(+)